MSTARSTSTVSRDTKVVYRNSPGNIRSRDNIVLNLHEKSAKQNEFNRSRVLNQQLTDSSSLPTLQYWIIHFQCETLRQLFPLIKDVFRVDPFNVETFRRHSEVNFNPPFLRAWEKIQLFSSATPHIMFMEVGLSVQLPDYTTRNAYSDEKC